MVTGRRPPLTSSDAAPADTSRFLYKYFGRRAVQCVLFNSDAIVDGGGRSRRTLAAEAVRSSLHAA